VLKNAHWTPALVQYIANHAIRTHISARSMMQTLGQTIAALDRYQVDYFACPGMSRKLLFTFTELGNRQLEGLGFGGKFALNNGFDLIAIKASSDDWYTGLPGSIFDQIGGFLDSLPYRHHWRATYGSSMGAYAAIMFAARLNADAVLALSPQYDIGLEWESRWVPQSRSIGVMPALQHSDVRAACRYVIAYDPQNLDRRHFELFEKVIPPQNLEPVRAFHAGHPVGYYLNAAGILAGLAIDVLNGNTPPKVAKVLRAGRDNYPFYLHHLAVHCRERNKLSWAASIIAKAVKLNPVEPEFYIRAAQIWNQIGAIDKAIGYAATAVALSPRHPHMIAFLAGLLHRKGLHAQALYYIKDAVSLLPESGALIEQLATVERASSGNYAT
jgi:tetratricopeptide (TPR) repeat protein